MVTTGTGSGKTECFMLPLFANLIRQKQESSQAEQHAVKAIMLYPLNALVEDQLSRMRKACNTDETRKWLSANCGGQNISFARYTSVTPKDSSDTSAKELTKAWTSLKKSLEDGENLKEWKKKEPLFVNT